MNNEELSLRSLAMRLGLPGGALPAWLPEPECRYLLARPELIARYSDTVHGEFLFNWEMSAVVRGLQIIDRIEHRLSVSWAEERVLDVGCADGGFLVAFALRGADAVGLDVESISVRYAGLRARCWDVDFDAVVASATDMPFRTGSMSLVTCGDVIEHVADRRRALAEIARVLRPSGILWMNAPTRFRLRNIWSDPHYHCFGAALLPARLAAWYVAYVRRKIASPAAYGVETLPVHTKLLRLISESGFEVIQGQVPHRRDPASIRRGWRQSLIRTMRGRPFSWALAPLSGLWAELVQPMDVICRRR